MESDGLGLDLALLDIDLVATEDDWDIFADTDKITYLMLVAASGVMIAHDLRCQLGTFLYVMREVTSNIMIPHWPLI